MVWVLCGAKFHGVENNVFAWQFAYNFDYVICCGIKAFGSFGKELEENVFFEVRAGYLIQNASVGFSYFIGW